MDLGVELAVALGQVVHFVLLGLQVIEGFLEGKITHVCPPRPAGAPQQTWLSAITSELT